jgi:hypothetical protein
MMTDSSRRARPHARFVAEPLESRLLLAAESVVAELDVNRLVAAGRATVTVTPGDIGSTSNIFDGDNASLYRTANIDPAVVELAFTSPKTVREFTLRFSHAGGNPAYRWKVEGAGGSLPNAPTWTELVGWTGTPSDVDSRRTLASPVTVQRLRLTGERLTGDNYVHLDEWHIVGDLTINSIAVSPASATVRQFQQKRFTANATDVEGIVRDFSNRVTWASTNEAAATVDASGLATAVGVGSAGIRASLGSLSSQGTLVVQAAGVRDLDVTYIERTPRYNYDAAKNNPAPGDLVTFRGHIKNWDNVTPSATYRWDLDGNPVASGTLSDLQPNEERVVTWQWTFQPGPHLIRLTVDPDNAVTEFSEANNVVEDRTDGVIVGFWVEQSLYNYFHDRQRDLGIGSNSWEDWAQRQMAKWNEHNASSIWDVTPNGVTDRVRIDKITVVPDNALPLNGGLAGNNPDSRDKTVDMMWGFEWDPTSTFYSNTTSKDPGNPFYLEPSLVHEMGHARYLVDEYTWDVANNSDVTQVQIIEPTTGRPVAGTSLMPYLAFDSVLYYNQSGGIMTGPYGNNIWSPHEAGALQRIAGRRAVAGNMNAPGNIGEFLNDLPAANHVRFVNGAGQPLVGADVRWYAASPGPGYGGKTFDNTPEYTLTADADGYVHLPRDPFLPGQHKEAVIRIASGGQIWYRFFEVGEMNLEYWRGHTQNGYYTIELPLRTAPAEMDVEGFGQSIADGDSTPSPADLTDFGEVNVTPTGPGDGSAIHTFVIKNRGGQPLTVDSVLITGANSTDFSVVYQPSTTVTSETLTVFQIKFDPRAQGIRTANVTISNNDSNENPYNFTIRGNGVVPGAQTFGTKFNDLDGDGQQDAGEPGMAGWTVFGDLNDNGTLDPSEPTTVTAPGGQYVLYGLPTNSITHIREVQKVGWRPTTPSAGYHTFNPFIDAIARPMDFGNTRAAAGAFVFYNNSAFDGRDAAANAMDDSAIATDKIPLRPGGTPTFANVTSYSRGLNGVMIDLAGASTAGLNDFTFRAGTGGDPSSWAPAPPPQIAVRPGGGAGGSTRVTFTWPDGSVRNQWLQFTVNPTTFTGLTAPDVYLFGNLVGDSSGALGVDAHDVIDTLRSLGDAAGITSPFDFNRDRTIDARDYAIARAAFGRSLAPPAVAPSAAGSAAVRRPTPARRRAFWPEEPAPSSLLQ